MEENCLVGRVIVDVGMVLGVINGVIVVDNRGDMRRRLVKGNSEGILVLRVGRVRIYNFSVME